MAIIAQDSFTEGANTALSAHVPSPTGTSWSSLYLRDQSIDTVDWGGDTAAADPICGRENTDVGDDDMDVSATVSPGASFASRNGGPVGRMNATDTDGRANHYHLAWGGDNILLLRKRIANSNTQLASYTDGGARDGRVIKLEIRAAAKKGYIDGVERVSSGDDNLVGNNFAGIHLSEQTANFLDDYLCESVTSAFATAAPEQLIRSGEV